MRVPDIIRDSLFGQIIYHCSGRRFLRYPEEEPGFVLPATAHASRSRSSGGSSRPASVTLKDSEQKAPVRELGVQFTQVQEESALAQEYLHHDAEKGKLGEEPRGEAHYDPNVVGWYGPDDPECPANVRIEQCLLGRALIHVWVCSGQC